MNTQRGDVLRARATGTHFLVNHPSDAYYYLISGAAVYVGRPLDVWTNSPKGPGMPGWDAAAKLARMKVLVARGIPK